MKTRTINIVQLPIAERELPLPQPQYFDTLDEAYQWANELVNLGLPAVANRKWSKFFTGYRHKSRMAQLLGIEPNAESICKKMAPNGRWLVAPLAQNYAFEFSAWYTEFTPYAWGMVQCEHTFECFGIDQSSMNHWSQSFMGYYDLANNDHLPSGFLPTFDKQQTRLFNNLYKAANEVRPPKRTFDEIFLPCAAYVAVKIPKVFAKRFPKLSKLDKEIGQVDYRSLVAEIKERCGL